MGIKSTMSTCQQHVFAPVSQIPLNSAWEHLRGGSEGQNFIYKRHRQEKSCSSTQISQLAVPGIYRSSDGENLLQVTDTLSMQEEEMFLPSSLLARY